MLATGIVATYQTLHAKDKAMGEAGSSPKSPSSSCQMEYEPLSFASIRTELAILKQVKIDISHSWERECYLYGQTMELEIDSTSQASRTIVPCRNYFNRARIVGDKRLFPYDDSCYDLLDAYDCLYKDGVQPMETNSERPTSISPSDRHYNQPPIDAEHMPVCPKTLTTWLRCNTLCKDDQLTGFYYNQIIDTSWEPSASSLPQNRVKRSAFLCKLLKHALSELQRDLWLAAAVLLQLKWHQDLDDISIFRQVLVILGSESVHCEFPCDNDDRDEPLNHDCFGWEYFLRFAVKYCFTDGITTITENHAVCLASFVRASFLDEFGSLVLDPADLESVEAKRKHLLKRTVVALRAEDDEAVIVKGDMNQLMPMEIILMIVVGLGERASKKNRFRENDIDKNLQTYFNCVRTLVSIAESSIQLLPANDRFYEFASLLLFALVQSQAANALELPNDGFFRLHYNEKDYIGFRDSSCQSSRLSVSSRYAMSICNSLTRTNAILEHQQISNYDCRRTNFESIFLKEPHTDIHNAIRGLFLRELVDLRTAGLGYGDCMIYCRFNINGSDPLLYWHGYNYPEEDEDSNSDGEEEEDTDTFSSLWDIDQNEKVPFTRGEMRAIYDYSLLLLSRAWQAPWTPDSHASFQPALRQANMMVAKCAHRLGLPDELTSKILSFLNRKWWPDARRQCWSYECQLNSLVKSVSRKFSENNSGPVNLRVAPTLSYCRCGVAMYCSKECRESDYKARHKKVCCRPPFISNIPDEKEMQLCIAVFSHSADSPEKVIYHTNPNHDDEDYGKDCENDGDINPNENDDESWETVASDEDVGYEDVLMSSKTLLYKYFKEKTYDMQRNR